MSGVKIWQAPPIGLPTLPNPLTGTEKIPMDQSTAGLITTTKATLAQMAAYFVSSTSILGTANQIAVAVAAGVATLSFPNTIDQYNAPLSLRYTGADVEFGHPNTAGYGSTLGTENNTGRPFLAFNAGPGTVTVNSYRTFGIPGAVMSSDLAGGFQWSSVATATADNQGLTTHMTLDAAGHLVVNAPSAAATTIAATAFAAAGSTAFQAVGSGNVAAAYYNANTASATLTMNSAGANYGTVGNTGTQTWGLGSANNLGPMSTSGSTPLQWNNGGSGVQTVAVGPGTFTSSGSVYQSAIRATLMLNAGTSGDSLIDFSINGTTNAFIQANLSAGYVRHYVNGGYLTFWANAIETGQIVDANRIYSAQKPGILAVANATFQRNATNGGFLDGNYPNVETGATPGCIYTIGGNTSGTSYYPSTSSLNTMYGVGYCLGNVTGIQAMGQPADWGFYVAAGGSGSHFFDASTGTYWNAGAVVPHSSGGNCTYFSGSGISIGGAGGKITAQSGGVASGGNAGDIILIY